MYLLLTNISIVVRPVPSTWVAPSYSLGEATSPQSVSTTKLVGSETFLTYSRGEVTMAAPATTIMMEPR